MAKEIKVALTLDTKNFDRNIVRAKGSMRGFGRSSKVATGSIIGLAARLAPLAAGIVVVAKSFQGLSKSLGVSAQFESVGVTLSNIIGSAEGGAAALNKIRDVAKELPVSFEELAGSAPALATVSANIGELEDNIRLAADIAGNFGIPFEVAAGQLQRAFSAGAGAADVFREKGVLAAAGFEAGVKVSIDETIAKFREFGAEVEGSAQSLNQTFAGATNQAGDALTDFQAAIGDAFRPEATVAIQNLTKLFRDNEDEVLAFAKSIGTNALKAIIAFGRGIAFTIDLLTSIGNTAKAIGQAIKENFGEQIEAVADAVVKAFGFITESISIVGIGLGKLISLTTGVNDVEHYFNSVNEAAANLRRNGLSAIQDTSTAIQGFVPSTAARDAFESFVDDVTAGAGEIRDGLEATSEAAKQLGDDLAINLGNSAKSTLPPLLELSLAGLSVAETIGKLLGITVEAVIPIGVFSSTISDLTDEQKKAQEASVRLKSGIETIRTAFDENLVTVEEYRATIAFLTKNFAELGLTAEQAAELIATLNSEFADQEGLRNFVEELENATKTLSEDLAGALLEGQSAGDSFKKFFKTMVNQIIADILRLMIIQPILSSIMAPFGLGFGTGGNIIRIPGKAMGGPVMANKPFVVGEKGPELFVPSSSGNIIPNHQLGGGTSQNITINAVDTQSFQQALARDPEFLFAVTQQGARSLPRS